MYSQAFECKEFDLGEKFAKILWMVQNVEIGFPYFCENSSINICAHDYSELSTI